MKVVPDGLPSGDPAEEPPATKKKKPPKNIRINQINQLLKSTRNQTRTRRIKFTKITNHYYNG